MCDLSMILIDSAVQLGLEPSYLICDQWFFLLPWCMWLLKNNLFQACVARGLLMSKIIN